MAKGWDMGRVRAFWRWAGGSKVPLDLMGLPFLGAVSYVLFRHAAALRPLEGALLVVATAGLLRTGLRWWDWHQGLLKDGPLHDWVQRILEGERRPLGAAQSRRKQDSEVVAALNLLIQDLQAERQELADLKAAVGRDWRDLDGLIGEVQAHHAADQQTRLARQAQLGALGRDLKAAIEDTLRLDQVELNYRLRADQFRLQGQAFRSTLEQVKAGLEQFENLLEELQDTFPRLRREEDALGRLADAGLRQGARLSLSVKAIMAHTPRLVDETQARTEWLRRLRQSTDGVRDLIQALSRRLEGFRAEAQGRIRSFGGAVGVLKELDHVAQQAGLLAVNASILAQQEGGHAGMAEIGNRLRQLADQTAEGTARMERTLDEYQRGLAHEAAGLWDLQEVAQRLASDVEELLRTSGHLDRQGHDLERALESHLGMVEHLRQASERAELSLHEVGARALALEAAHGRQWGVEAKITPERERLVRVGARLGEVGEGLAHISQQNIDEIWDILARHQEVRKTRAYQQVTSEGLPGLMNEPEGAGAAWGALGWARAQRRPRWVQSGTIGGAPTGWVGRNGEVHLLLMAQDALQMPEPSAIEGWHCDGRAQTWNFILRKPLRQESLRLALLALLKESPLAACFPGLDMRIAADGVQVRLPQPYISLPAFIAGLRLALVLEREAWSAPLREVRPAPARVQRVLWLGPGQGGGLRHPLTRLVHQWVGEDHHHEAFLPWLPHPGHRPPCPWIGDAEADLMLPEPVPLRCLSFGAEGAVLAPLRERLLQVGAVEGTGGATLCAIDIGHPHPEALLLRLFQADVDLAGSFHPDLVPFQIRLREDVLGAATGDPYQSAWSLLADLHRAGWLLPLPEA